MSSASSTVTVVELKRSVADATVGGGRSRGVALRMDISIMFMAFWADDPSTSSLDCDSGAMPSARSTITVVEPQRRGERRHGENQTLMGSHSSYAYSREALMSLHVWSNGTYTIVFVECLAHNTATVYAPWFAMNVPCRQRAAQSPRRS